MGHKEDLDFLEERFPDASRSELWTHCPAGRSRDAAAISLMDAGFPYRDKDVTNHHVGSPEAKKRRPGTAPREDEDEGSKLSHGVYVYVYYVLLSKFFLPLTHC